MTVALGVLMIVFCRQILYMVELSRTSPLYMKSAPVSTLPSYPPELQTAYAGWPCLRFQRWSLWHGKQQIPGIHAYQSKEGADISGSMSSRGGLSLEPDTP